MLPRIALTLALTVALSSACTKKSNGTDSTSSTDSGGTVAAASGGGIVTTTTATATATASSKPTAAAMSITVAQNASYSGTLSGTVATGNTATYAKATAGTLGTFTITNATTGAFTYVPTGDNYGSDSFTYTVSDGTTTSAAATVAVTITQSGTIAVTGTQNYGASGGSTITLSATRTRADTTTQNVNNIATWASSNTAVATVTQGGVVTTVGAGTATITATLGSLSGTMPVYSTGLIAAVPLTWQLSGSTYPITSWNATARPNSTEMWITAGNSCFIGVFDTSTNTQSTYFVLDSQGGGASCSTVSSLAFRPDGAKAYIAGTNTSSHNNYAYVFDATAKTQSAKFSASGLVQQFIAAKDGSAMYYADGTNVYPIDTTHDTQGTALSSMPSHPTGMTISPDGKTVYISDGGHGGGGAGSDWIYTYPSFPAATGATNIVCPKYPTTPIGYLAAPLTLSSNGVQLFASNLDDDFIFNTSNMSATPLSVQQAPQDQDYGPFAPFSDNARVIMSSSRNGDYEVFSYSTSSATYVESIPGVTANGQGVPVITANQLLYLPDTAANAVKVYQYH